jgi:hypothetical protein
MKPEWLSDARLIPDDVMDDLQKIAVHAVEEHGYAGLDTKKTPGCAARVTEEMDAWLKQTVLESTS